MALFLLDAEELGDWGRAKGGGVERGLGLGLGFEEDFAGFSLGLALGF